MFKSLLSAVIVFQLVTIACTTLGFITSPLSSNKLYGTSMDGIIENLNKPAQQTTEVAVFWTPKFKNASSEYQVVRKNLHDPNDNMVVACVKGDEILKEGYITVQDSYTNNSVYSYEVLQLTSQGQKTVSSMAVILQKAN